MVSLRVRLVVTSLFTQFRTGHTAAPVTPTSSANLAAARAL